MVRRRWLGVALATAAAMVVLLVAGWAASGEGVTWWHALPPRDATPPSTTTVPRPVRPSRAELPLDVPTDTPGRGGFEGTVFVLVAVAVLTLAIGWWLAGNIRRRPPSEPPPAPPTAGGLDLAQALAELDAATDDLFARLATGTPRNAIVACWVRLEEAVTDRGLTPDASETSTELTRRVLGRFGVADATIVHLAALYREARFSHHPLDETHRADAIATLRNLLDALPDQVPS